MPTLMMQTCVDQATAMELAGLPSLAPLTVPGRVETRRNMGVLFARVLREAVVVQSAP